MSTELLYLRNQMLKTFNKSRNSLLAGSLILGLPMILLHIYNYNPYTFHILDIELRKIKTETVNKEALLVLKRSNSTKTKTTIITNKVKQLESNVIDVSHRILFLGDSETERLKYPLNAYCEANNHKLEAVFTWYSATILNFGFSKKADSLIKKYKPTLIVFVVGLNELRAKDLEKREKAAKQFRTKIGKTPYLWIGPANYREDEGINLIFENTADEGHFFLSKNLKLDRASDNRHPSKKGCEVWMDSIASFIRASSVYNFKFEKPKTTDVKFKSKVIMANAAKDKGY